MKTGYHYTSWSNWLSIQEEGLQPYIVNKPELRTYFPQQTIRGIWTWLDRPTNQSELGSIIFQVSTKQETKIVCLEYQYYTNDALDYDGRLIKLYHDGHVGSWMYHENEPAIILLNPIQSSDIKLVQTFDLMDIVGLGDAKGKHKELWRANIPYV